MEIYENERINEINENLRLIEKKDSLTFGTDAYLLSAFIPKSISWNGTPAVWSQLMVVFTDAVPHITKIFIIIT